MTYMRPVRAKLNENGRLVIPAAYRKALNLHPGDELLIRLEGDELRISSARDALACARRLIRQYIPDDEDLTQSLINDRRKEAELE
jgi:AbrB family looped-hinge helix DNA binding protein